MPRYRKTVFHSSLFNNDHRLAGFTFEAWYKWRRFLKKWGLLPKGRS